MPSRLQDTKFSMGYFFVSFDLEIEKRRYKMHSKFVSLSIKDIYQKQLEARSVLPIDLVDNQIKR